ncbi:19660_t:CDS:2, partial [Gigaspora rosea]
NDIVNGVDTLYENNQFEFDLGNQNENNFVVNSETYQEEFQTDATFQLAEKLTACVLKEDKKTDYSLFRASAPKAALVATANTIFLNINLNDPTLFGENRNLDIVARSMLDLVDSNKWYNETSSNSAQDPFLVAQKFEMEQLVTMGYKPQTINERKLYGEACGKARVALAVAVRRRDYNFIAILDKYLDDCQEVLSSNSDSNAFSDNEIEAGSNISNEKLDPKELTNPYKRKARDCAYPLWLQ